MCYRRKESVGKRINTNKQKCLKYVLWLICISVFICIGLSFSKYFFALRTLNNVTVIEYSCLSF